MQCPRCHADNRAGRRLCAACGQALALPCPQSYTPSHLAEKILATRATLEGERQQVTVLFADLKGSMELLADRDPEEARQLLDPVLECMMAALRRYSDEVRREPPEIAPTAAHYRQALALAEELGMRPLQAYCHLGLGTLYARSGQPGQARTELSAAMALYRPMARPRWRGSIVSFGCGRCAPKNCWQWGAQRCWPWLGKRRWRGQRPCCPTLSLACGVSPILRCVVDFCQP